MSDTYKCAWCGSRFEKGAASKFFSGATMGFSDFGKKYCSKSCEHAAEEAKSGPKSSSHSNNDPIGANQSGNGTTIVNKGDGFLAAGVKTFGALLDDTAEKELEREEKKRLDGKIDDISQMNIGSTVEEICNQLNHLSALASTKPDKKLKNVIIEKMEFGIMKLRSVNAMDEVDFFEKKLAPIKKKSWF